MKRMPLPVIARIEANKEKIDAAKYEGYTDEVLKRGVRGHRELTEIDDIIKGVVDNKRGV